MKRLDALWRRLVTERVEDNLGRSQTTAIYAIEMMFEEQHNRLVRVATDLQNEMLGRLARVEDQMNTRLDAQDAVLTDQNLVLATLQVELQGGVKEMQVGFETVVERQFIKEQMIKSLSVQLREMAIQMERAQIQGEPPSPEHVRDMYQVAAQLQEVVAAA